MAIRANERACPYCHMVTRADSPKCIHCHHTVDQSRPTMQVAPIGRTFPAGTAPN